MLDLPVAAAGFYATMTLLFALIWWVRGRRARTSSPELTNGYLKLVRGLSFWGNLPWAVMAIAAEAGHVESTSEFLAPTTLNPFVLAWYGSLVVVWISGTHWLFFRQGAEIVAQHPGFMGPAFNSPGMIKGFWLVGVLGGLFGLALSLIGIYLS